MVEDRVRLTIESVADAAAPARVTGAGLAFRLGLPYQSVEDFRVAVDAAVTLASTYLRSPVQVVYTLETDRLRVALASEVSDNTASSSTDSSSTDSSGADSYPEAVSPDAGALAAFESVVGELVTSQHVDDEGTIHLEIEKLASPESA